MPRKIDRKREIDEKPASVITGGEGMGPPTIPTTGPAVPSLPAPTNLAIASNVLMFSAVTPMALIGLTWNAPPGVVVASYLVEAATNSTFTTGLIRRTVYQASASLELPTGTAYWFRVAAYTTFVNSPYSASVTTTTATDTTASAVPTSLAAAFNAAGDLEITWVNPTSNNFRDVEVSIYGDSGFTVLLYRTYSATQRIVWTASQNRQAGSGTPDVAVFVRMASRNWAGVLSATVVPTVQPVKAVPANVGSLAQSWDSDAGTAGADLVVTWAAASGAVSYRLSIDGTARDVFGLRYVYPLDQNTSEHAGTPDPVLSLSLVGVDGFDQVSATPTTTTATNAAPIAPTLATLIAAPGLIVVSVSATEPPDFLSYRFRIIQTLPSAGDVTLDSQSKTFTYNLATAATYQVGVRMVDRFGQAGTETLTGTGVLDLTIATLRAEAVYSDSASGVPATLKAALADDVRGSGGISYTSSGSERWIRFERALTERYRYVTLAMVNLSGSASWYLRTSSDGGTTWSYFAGPVTGGRILTAVANQAAAQAARVAIGTLGSVAAGDRVELPTTTEARYIEVFWLNSTGTTRVDEYYPRRLVEADDIRAQTLAAISADLGTITAGTITGATIQTATSGARIELTSANGLRSYDSSNVLQTQIRTSDGKLVFGAGVGFLDVNGIYIDVPSGVVSNVQSYQFTSGGTVRSRVGGAYTPSENAIEMRALSFASRDSTVGLTAEVPTGQTAIAQLETVYGLEASVITIDHSSAGGVITLSSQATTASILLDENTTVSGGLNVGAVSGATAGQIVADGQLFLNPTTALTNAATTSILFRHNTSGTPAAGFGVDLLWQLESTTSVRSAAIDRTIWTNATDASRTARRQFYVYDTAARECLRLEANGSAAVIGFFGSAGTTRPNVAGSRGGNVALTNLLTVLAGLGLITDSTT